MWILQSNTLVGESNNNLSLVNAYAPFLFVLRVAGKPWRRFR